MATGGMAYRPASTSGGGGSFGASSNGGRRSSSTSGGGKGNSGLGSGVSNGGFAWNGAANQNFDAEGFGQQIGSSIQHGFLQGPAPQWQGNMYAGLGEASRGGMSGLLDVAGNASGMFDGATDYSQGLIGSGGLAGGQRGNIGTVNRLGAEAGNPSLTEQTLLGRATGAEVANNPFLDDIVRQTNDSTYADVMASLGSSGRTRSGAHMDELGTALANNETGLRYTDYNNALGRQTEALGLIEQMRQQGFSNQMGAASNAFGMEQQGVSNAMGAAASLPGLYQASLMPYQTQLQVGAMQDADRQAKIQADRERFERLNDPPYNHIAKWTGLLGAQQGAAPQPEQQPGLFDWLGLGVGAAGLLL